MNPTTCWLPSRARPPIGRGLVRKLREGAAARLSRPGFRPSPVRWTAFRCLGGALIPEFPWTAWEPSRTGVAGGCGVTLTGQCRRDQRRTGKQRRAGGFGR